jgi:hypothetical protein
MPDTLTVPIDLDDSRAVFTPAADDSGRTRQRRRLHGLCQERQDAAKLRAALIEHVGGRPSPVQLAMIDALAALKVKIAVFDSRFIEESGMSPHARRDYLAFVNSYTRTLRLLGLKGAPERGPSLAEILAAGPPARVRTAPPDAPDAMAPPAAQAASGPPAAPAEVI